MPAFAGEPVSASASSAYAIAAICEPRLDTSCAIWSSMKSRFRRRGIAVIRRR
jgi:hypothetical protein